MNNAGVLKKMRNFPNSQSMLNVRMVFFVVVVTTQTIDGSALSYSDAVRRASCQLVKTEFLCIEERPVKVGTVPIQY